MNIIEITIAGNAPLWHKNESVACLSSLGARSTPNDKTINVEGCIAILGVRQSMLGHDIKCTRMTGADLDWEEEKNSKKGKGKGGKDPKIPKIPRVPKPTIVCSFN